MYVIIGTNGYIGAYMIKNIFNHTQENILAVGRRIDCSYQHKRLNCIKCDIADGDDITILSQRIKMGKMSK